MGEASHHAPFGGGELGWALISTALALVVVLVASRVVGAQRVVPAVEDAEPAGMRKILYNKWYVDELYDRIVVQPVLRLSRWCWKVVDSLIIDGLVNLIGNVARALGWVTSLFHSGQVNTYAFILTLGVLVILGVMAF